MVSVIKNKIKDLDTTHETWIGNFSSQHKKKLKICQELYKVDQHNIDKTEYSTGLCCL